MGRDRQSIEDDIEDVLHNTQDIKVIDTIVTGIEKTINEGELMTDNIPLPLASYDYRLVDTILDINKVKPILTSLIHNCLVLEEYEMCERINTIFLKQK
mgnify:CR=1 FL=1|jgi:hypothetical protein|tara:strand:- start:211 stop:507 length:297 start_codon:yes stop_codon:yes gene_type:complete